MTLLLNVITYGRVPVKQKDKLIQILLLPDFVKY